MKCDNCKNDLLSFAVGNVLTSYFFVLPALISTSFSLRIMSVVPLPKIALSSGSGNIPLESFGTSPPLPANGKVGAILSPFDVFVFEAI